MEGDVSAILTRPTLPPPSPALNDPSPSTSTTDNKNGNANAVHRYASRDLRTREAQAEIEKWDAWHACAGMSRTEAKRRYISTLIETMKEYASGTQESRELVGELEFVWGQIQSQENSQGSVRSGSGEGEAKSGGSGSGGSPRRSGLARLDSMTGESISGGQQRSRRLGLSRRGTEKSGDEKRMRLLSPVSQRDPEDVIEGADDDDEEDKSEDLNERTGEGQRNPAWRTTVQAQLRQLSTEIAALREQLSANNLLSSSAYSPYTNQLSLKWKIIYRIWRFLRWAAWAAVRQCAVNVALIGILMVWSRWRGDRRVEEWAKRRWKEVRVVVGEVEWWSMGWWRLLKIT
jgi:hypothetical protein